jgi:hypothetical protein
MKTTLTQIPMEQAGKHLSIIITGTWGFTQDIFNGLSDCDVWGFLSKVLGALLFGGLGWLGGYLMQMLFKGKKTK